MLSACDQKLRDLIHSSVTTLVVRNFCNFDDVLKGYWPQAYTLCRSADSSFQVIASLVSQRSTNAVLAVSHNIQVHLHRSIATTFKHLQSPEWDFVSSVQVIMKSLDEGGHGTCGAFQLAPSQNASGCLFAARAQVYETIGCYLVAKAREARLKYGLA